MSILFCRGNTRMVPSIRFCRNLEHDWSCAVHGVGVHDMEAAFSGNAVHAEVAGPFYRRLNS